MQNNKLKHITECGMLMAAALALSYIKIFQLPGGGSISLSCIPLLVLAARHGFIKGTLCCGIYGILLCMNKPTIVHPIQFLLDYPMAYGCFGIAGLAKWAEETETGLKKNLLKAITVTTASNLLRLHMHVITGIVFFSNLKSGETIDHAVRLSYGYNLMHILPETLICIVFTVYVINKYTKLCVRQ